MAAQKAGLKPGDVLLEIDGEDLTGMTTQQVSDRLRGEPGTSFMLKYERPGLAEPQTVKVTRENVQTPAVPYYGMLKDHVGYIVLSSFFDGCSRDVRRLHRTERTRSPRPRARPARQRRRLSL